MKVVQFKLVSKNSKKNKIYIYAPVASDGVNYYTCRFLHATEPIKFDSKTKIDIIRVINTELYAAFGLN